MFWYRTLVVFIPIWTTSEATGGLFGTNPDEIADTLKNFNLLRLGEFFERDLSHLKEHMEDSNIDLDEVSREQKDFYYFQTHDLNGDNILDGIELYSALEHSFVSHRSAEADDMYDVTTANGMRRWKKLQIGIIENVDMMLRDDDTDDDGYLDYQEFSTSRRTMSLKQS